MFSEVSIISVYHPSRDLHAIYIFASTMFSRTSVLTDLGLCFLLVSLLPCDHGETESFCNATASLHTVGESDVCVSTLSEGNHYNCSSLQSALEFLTSLDTDEFNCTAVELSPGVHILTRNTTIRQNVMIRGRDSQVDFMLEERLLTSLSPIDPIAVISFESSNHVYIEGVVFGGSPGFIQIENVTEVTIFKTTFR